MRQSFDVLLKVLWVVLFVGCATSPTGRRQFVIVPEERVERLGNKTFERIKKFETVETNSVDNAYVRCVVDAISSSISQQQPWEVVLFANDEANAFALPGGKIGVNTGLLRVAVNSDQLAAVLGHEIGHVVAQHGREQVSRQTAIEALKLTGNILGRSGGVAPVFTSSAAMVAQFELLYPFNRLQEEEADLIGLRLMTKAGFDPKQAIAFWKNMDIFAGASGENVLATHPSDSKRLDILRGHLAEVMEGSESAHVHPTCSKQ
jgi:predicted Zn-dependent protease